MPTAFDFAKETDEHGIRAVEKPAHVHDFHATILHLMGLNHTKLTYRDEVVKGC